MLRDVPAVIILVVSLFFQSPLSQTSPLPRPRRVVLLVILDFTPCRRPSWSLFPVGRSNGRAPIALDYGRRDLLFAFAPAASASTRPEGAGADRDWRTGREAAHGN